MRTEGYGMVEIDDQARGLGVLGGSGHGFTILENPSMDYNAAAPSPCALLPLLLGGRLADLEPTAPAWPPARARSVPASGRPPNEPWLETRGAAGGPGGLSVFRTASGARWVAYHSWERGKPTSNGRRLHVEPLGYQGITPLFLNRGANGTFNASTPGPAWWPHGHGRRPRHRPPRAGDHQGGLERGLAAHRRRQHGVLGAAR